MRNALATVERCAGSSDFTSFFFRDRLIVHWSIGQTAGHGISHHFEQVNNDGNLTGSQLLDQIMGLLFFVRSCHRNSGLRRRQTLF